MVRPFARLAVGLQAVAHVAQQLGDDIVADRWPSSRSPAASLRRLLDVHSSGDRIAARRRLDQRRDQPAARVRLAQRLAPAALPGVPARAASGCRLAAQFRQPTADRAARDAGGPRHRRDPAMPSRQRLRRRKTPPPALVQHRSERPVAQFDRRIVNHPVILRAWKPPGNPLVGKIDSANLQRALMKHTRSCAA